MSRNGNGSHVEELDDLLAAWDEALAAGLTPYRARDVPGCPDLRRRLERGVACIRRLRHCWPQGGPARPLPNLGRFQIRGELGRGAFGVVFRAYDPQLRRDVALKVPHVGTLLAPGLRERFLREARAGAGLDHPNLVPVYETGEAGPVCYIVSAYCPGPTLAAWLGERSEPIPPRLAAALVATLAEAVQHAHARGVLHRDLKPSNVLLEGAGGPSAPDALLPFVPRVTDFGLAKLLAGGQAEQTAGGSILGTPSHMAPEQAAGRGNAVGPAADVYALGAILYQLLTGRVPFQADSVLDLLEQVRSQDPVPPRRLRPKLPADLETVCLKCLEKDPAKRYASAAALAEDLRRSLDGRPVRARPASAWERGVKWARRRPALAALLAVSATAALLLVGGSLAFTRALLVERDNARYQEGLAREEEGLVRQERDRVRAEQQAGRRALYAAHVRLAEQAYRENNPGRVLEILMPYGNAADAGEEDVRGWEWFYLRSLCHRGVATLQAEGRREGPTHLAFSPDGRWLAAVTAVGRVHVWNNATRDRVTVLQAAGGAVCLAFCPDRRQLLVGCRDGAVRAWATDGWQPAGALRVGEAAVLAVALRPDGGQLAAAGADGRVTVWARGPDADKGGPPRLLVEHWVTVLDLGYSPDGRWLAGAGRDGAVRLWGAADGVLRRTLSGHAGPVTAVAFGPDGRLLASGGEDATVRLWDVRTGNERRVLRGHTEPVTAVVFHPDGRRLASTALEGTLRFWDGVTGRETGRLSGHWDFLVRGLACSPDGLYLVTGAQEGTVRFWHPDGAPADARPLEGHAGSVRCVAFAPDSRTLASGGDDGTVRLWEAVSGRAVRALGAHQGAVAAVAYRPDGGLLATAGRDDRTVKFWEVPAGTLARTLRADAGVLGLALSPDGRVVAGALADGTARLWDATTGDPVLTLRGHRGAVRSVAFAPDGTWLATGGDDGLRLWDRDTGRERRGGFPVIWVRAVAVSPDGKWVATAGVEWRAHVWDAATGARVWELTGHVWDNHGVAFSRDGRRLVTAGGDRTVRVWDMTSGLELLALGGHAKGMLAAALSADGERLASGGADGIVRLWDAPSVRRVFHHPVDAPWSPEQVAAWHEHEAVSAEAVGHWHAAAWHLDRLDPPGPAPWQLLDRRGRAHFELGRFPRAADELAAAAAQSPDGWTWVRHCYGRLAVGDADGYRRARGVLGRFGAGADARLANGLARAGVLLPGAAAEFAPAVRLAEAAVAARPDDPNFLATLGAALYRAGRFEESVRRTGEAVAARKGGGDARDGLYLALAHHRLGHADEARRWLARAEEWAGRLEREPVPDGATSAAPQAELLELRLLRAEVETLGIAAAP